MLNLYSSRSLPLRLFLSLVVVFSSGSNIALAETKNRSCHEEIASTSDQDDRFRLKLAKRLKELCGRQTCDRLSILKGLSDTIRSSPRYRRAKSYMALVGIMVGTSSLTLAVSSAVGPEHSMLSGFLTIFLSQITALGVYVVGAPIWEPLTSAIRARGYMHTHPQDVDLQAGSLQELEDQYFRTNSMLSINAQMSRNI